VLGIFRWSIIGAEPRKRERELRLNQDTTVQYSTMLSEEDEDAAQQRNGTLVVLELQASSFNLTPISYSYVRRTMEDAALAQELERSPSATSILVEFPFGLVSEETFIPSDYPLLTRAISSREILTEVRFRYGGCPPRPPPWPAFPAWRAPLVLRFWHAAQSIASIKKFDFYRYHFDLGSELFTSLCNRLSATASSSLVLGSCDMLDPTQRQQGARALLASSTIESLEIRSCQQPFACALLQNLNQNPNRLKNLMLSTMLSNDIASLVGQILEATTTIQRFDLRNSEVVHSQWFRSTVCSISKFQMRIYAMKALVFFKAFC